MTVYHQIKVDDGSRIQPGYCEMEYTVKVACDIVLRLVNSILSIHF
jgi:hypothetical protein